MRVFVYPILLAAGLAATPSQAETVKQSLDGTQLALRLSCVKSVDIQPDPALKGKVQVEASAAAHDELDPLHFTGGTTAQIERTGNCGLFLTHPTLTLAIKVPPATPIDLQDAGSGSYQIGVLGAPLKLDMAGSGKVDAVEATDLDLHIAGSGDLTLQHLTGPGRIDIRGSGTAQINDGTIPALSVTITGSGDARLAAGDVTTLSASITGSGSLRIDGTVKDASLSTSGSGDIDIAKATGAVQKHKAGSGAIHIGS